MEAQAALDPSKQTRFVRVTGIKQDKFVEFDFSIGDPTIFVELVLPFEQFDTFCQRHQAQKLSDEQITQVDLDSQKWRYGQPSTAINE